MATLPSWLFFLIFHTKTLPRELIFVINNYTFLSTQGHSSEELVKQFSLSFHPVIPIVDCRSRELKARLNLIFFFKIRVKCWVNTVLDA